MNLWHDLVLFFTPMNVWVAIGILVSGVSMFCFFVNKKSFIQYPVALLTLFLGVANVNAGFISNEIGKLKISYPNHPAVKAYSKAVNSKDYSQVSEINNEWYRYKEGVDLLVLKELSNSLNTNDPVKAKIEDFLLSGAITAKDYEFIIGKLREIEVSKLDS